MCEVLVLVVGGWWAYLVEGGHKRAWGSLDSDRSHRGLVECGRRRSGGRVRGVLGQRPCVIVGGSSTVGVVHVREQRPCSGLESELSEMRHTL